MNILFLTHRVPFAPNRGDRIRAFHLLRALADIGRVSVFSLVHDDEEARAVEQLPHAVRSAGVRVKRLRNLLAGAAYLPTSRPLTHALLDAPNANRVLRQLVAAEPPDLVVAFCTGMARFAMEPPLANIPFVLDMVDVDSVKWAELAAATSGPKRWIYQRESTTLAAFEADAARAAITTLVINEREQQALRRIAPRAHVEVVENGIDVDAFRSSSPPTEKPVVIFCGVMNYAPNVQGMRWFVQHIWPLVRAEKPDAELLIVGSNPTPEVIALGADDASIRVTGAVPTVQPYLWEAALSVAPLGLARGLQNKVLEALAAKLPVVVTPQVMAGLPDEARSGCIEAESANEFARAVVATLDLPPSGRREIASRASLQSLRWNERLRPLRQILNFSGGAEQPWPDAPIGVER